jgi:hypothetical protein
VRYASGVGVNPFSPAARHRIADSIHADVLVVVAAHGENGRYFAERADQIAELIQFSRSIHQVAAQEQSIDRGSARRLDYLPTELVGTFPPKVDVARIHQTARVVSHREALFADVKGAVKADR